MKCKRLKCFHVLIYPITGLIALLWFLIRVIPKPNRALYPCQKVAFSVASGFLGQVLSLSATILIFRKAHHYLKNNKYIFMALFFIFGFIGFVVYLNLSSDVNYAWTPSDLPNSPVGNARGIYAGRVVWVHDPEATSWDGTTGCWWESSHTNQTVVDSMLSRSIRWLTEESDDSLAWDALFRYYNQSHGKGNIGYSSDEKISIKLNLVTCDSHGTCDNAIYSLPQLVLALLRQLVNNLGISDSQIMCYDLHRYIPSTIYDICHAEFPGTHFVDWVGGDGREKYIRDTDCIIHWSEDLTLEIGGGNTAYFPTCVTEADYIINLATMKGHQLTGITLCAKNGFGSIDADRDGAPYQSAPKAAGVHPYVAVHDFLLGGEWNFYQRYMGTYNPLVDLMGHQAFGARTLLFLVDGYYGAVHQSVNTASEYVKWSSSPFNNDWPSSLFISQDNVAIESVVLDFMSAEPAMTEVYGNVDNYLHEAAQADDPSSGTFYDPEGDGSRLTSLGVHEHWNNAADKQYSRNLGTGQGIELISSDPLQSVSVSVRVFLEGPYDASGDTMETNLRGQGYLPLSSPFSEDTLTVDVIPHDITDWVLVQLRTQIDGPAVASKSAFLRNDGWIVSANSMTPYVTINASDGDYYIVIRHRNHLAVMSSDVVSLK